MATKFTTSNLKTPKAQREALWTIVLKNSGHPDLVAKAAQIIRECNIEARDTKKLAECLQTWVASNIKYFSEYPDRWQSPLRTLDWRIGDCDDQTILMASILRSFKVPVRIVFLRWVDPKTKKKKGHVFSQALVGKKWTSLETVRPRPFGWDAGDMLLKKGVRPTREVIGDA